MSDGPTESELVRVWQHQLLERADLVTEAGEPIEIVYPGRLNDDRGADFRDAAIVTGGGLSTGDVEIHVRSSGWREHGHHQDRAYNRVILHVVMWDNSGWATLREDGRVVPVLALHKYVKAPGERPSSVPDARKMPCFNVASRLSPGNMARLLDEVGTERFLVKVSRFQQDLARTEAGQCLYQGIMSALGYSKNKLPFMELARRLPLQLLESIATSRISDEECLARQQALLLGTAGLLPLLHQSRTGNSDSGWAAELEKYWTCVPAGEAMSPESWCLFRIRPGNSPVRRLLAMSYLLVRYRRQGILEGLTSLVKEAAPGENGHGIEVGLLVSGNYQAERPGFSSAPQAENLARLGWERSGDIVVNVLLPFTAAWGKVSSRQHLVRKALALYHGYRKLAVNSVVRHMIAQLGLSGSLVNSARRQQGLTHIYHTLCARGKCRLCECAYKPHPLYPPPLEREGELGLREASPLLKNAPFPRI